MDNISIKWVVIGFLAVMVGNYFFNFPAMKGRGDGANA